MDRYWSDYSTYQLRGQLKKIKKNLSEALEWNDSATMIALECTERSIQIEIAERERDAK